MGQWKRRRGPYHSFTRLPDFTWHASAIAGDDWLASCAIERKIPSTSAYWNENEPGFRFNASHLNASYDWPAPHCPHCPVRPLIKAILDWLGDKLKDLRGIANGAGNQKNDNLAVEKGKRLEKRQMQLPDATATVNSFFCAFLD